MKHSVLFTVLGMLYFLCACIHTFIKNYERWRVGQGDPTITPLPMSLEAFSLAMYAFQVAMLIIDWRVALAVFVAMIVLSWFILEDLGNVLLGLLRRLGLYKGWNDTR